MDKKEWFLCSKAAQIAHKMEEKNLYNISISHLREYLPADKWVGVDNDFFIIDVTYDNNYGTFKYPCRFDGYLLIFCLKGAVRLSLNMNDYDLKENMFLLSMPGNILKVSEYIDECPQEDIHYALVAMSQEFMSELKIDVNKFFGGGVSLLEKPCLKLGSQELEFTEHSFSLMAKILTTDIPYKKEAVISQLSSLVYVMSGLWAERLAEVRRTAPITTNRSKIVFEQFIRLVSEYHTQYRNVGFYADKLCLTPKYLSKLIKDATGKSAPEWIDSYVILEAKNLLKYSGISIKEIVYRLNFPNQSVFYKFFKARTGQTPSEYRIS